MTTKQVAAQIRQIVSVLAGARKASSDNKCMRLLQLKRWLTDERGEDDRVLKRAASAYASMRVTEIVAKEMNDLKRGREPHMASDAFRSLIEDEDENFLQMIDASFGCADGYQTIYAFRASKRWTQRLESSVAFVDFCLRLHISGHDYIKGKASKLYTYASAEKNGILLKDVEPILRDLRARLAFLYVAKTEHDWLFLHPNNRREMQKLLREQVQDLERLRDYFARCACVQSVLSRGQEIAGEEIAEWAGVQPLAPAELRTISKEEIELAESFVAEREGR